MRRLKKNPQDTFRVKAYAGTSGVLLGMDVDQSRANGLLGFAIEHKEGAKPWRFLLNSLTFPGRAHTLEAWKATPSNLAPIQKFRWADYTIPPRTTRNYRVHLAYGTAAQPVLDESLEVEVTTDDGKPEDHRVHFNRAVAASQSFGRQFPEVDQLLKDDPRLPIEDWPEKPRKWLENGLLKRIIDFIERATGDTWAIDVAIYEYELGAIVDAVNAAHKRGVDVRVLYHAQNGDDQTDQNIAHLKKIPASRKRGRVTSKIFHHKFIVLSKLSAAGERLPKAVLCGSTNFTENGVYRQANVVHLIERVDVARSYAELFTTIWSDPTEVGTARSWINQNNPIATQGPLFVGFSPRTGQADLKEFVRIIQGASRDVLFATAFKLPENILNALLGQANDPILRYGIQNSTSRITGFHADRTAEFVTPALLKSGLEGWIKEGLRGQRGNLLIHTKAIVTDFTTDSPTVISGSHNLSVPASASNDENFLIMRGDTDLADRYGIEILRFYEHYRFRFYAKKLALSEVRPLGVDNSWSRTAYQQGSLKQTSRLLFAGR